MDPEILTSRDWSNIGGLLRILWLYVIFVLGIVTNILLAQAIIPSLVATHHLPERALQLRPLLFGVPLVAFLLAVASMIVVVGRADVIPDFYDRWWI